MQISEDSKISPTGTVAGIIIAAANPQKGTAESLML